MDTEVREWIEQKRQVEEYLKISHKENISETEWFEKVDASKQRQLTKTRSRQTTYLNL